jgi:hypothetical protein
MPKCLGFRHKAFQKKSIRHQSSYSATHSSSFGSSFRYRPFRYMRMRPFCSRLTMSVFMSSPSGDNWAKYSGLSLYSPWEYAKIFMQSPFSLVVSNN